YARLRAVAGGSRAPPRVDRRALRRDARRGPGRRGGGVARALSARRSPAVDARRRLSPGVAAPRRRERCRDDARARDRGDAPARQAPAHVAPRDAGDGPRSAVAVRRRHRRADRRDLAQWTRFRHPREGGDPAVTSRRVNRLPITAWQSWIPAFAGMTAVPAIPAFAGMTALPTRRFRGSRPPR